MLLSRVVRVMCLLICFSVFIAAENDPFYPLGGREFSPQEQSSVSSHVSFSSGQSLSSHLSSSPQSSSSSSDDGWPDNWILAASAGGAGVVLALIIMIIAGVCSRDTNGDSSSNVMITDEM